MSKRRERPRGVSPAAGVCHGAGRVPGTLSALRVIRIAGPVAGRQDPAGGRVREILAEAPEDQLTVSVEAEHLVTDLTEQASHLARGVIMVDAPATSTREPPADGTQASL